MTLMSASNIASFKMQLECNVLDDSKIRHGLWDNSAINFKRKKNEFSRNYCIHELNMARGVNSTVMKGSA